MLPFYLVTVLCFRSGSGLGTENIWLGLKKIMFCFKISGFVTTNWAGSSPDLTMRRFTGLVEMASNRVFSSLVAVMLLFFLRFVLKFDYLKSSSHLWQFKINVFGVSQRSRTFFESPFTTIRGTWVSDYLVPWVTSTVWNLKCSQTHHGWLVYIKHIYSQDL